GRLADRVGELPLAAVERRVEQQCVHADDPVHRRPYLMTHRREKIRLRAIGVLRRMPGLLDLELARLPRGDVAIEIDVAAAIHRRRAVLDPLSVAKLTLAAGSLLGRQNRPAPLVQVAEMLRGQARPRERGLARSEE